MRLPDRIVRAGLTVKIALSLALVVATGVAVTALAAGQATRGEFQTYVQAGGQMYASRAAQSLTGYYASEKSWRDVGPLLAGLQRTVDDHLILADEGGTIVGDTAGELVGRKAVASELGSATQLSVGGRSVGMLYLSATQGTGRGPGMGGLGRGPRWQIETGAGSVTSPEQRFTEAVNESLGLSAAAAGVLAILLGILLSWQIVRPLRSLTLAARVVAGGDLTQRVRVVSSDEVGELAGAFNSMAESLERAERSRRNLFADIAHELRTPLTVIEGTADAILDGVFEPTPERIRAIREEAALLAQIISDLRDLSLADSGHLDLARASTDPGEIAAGVARGAAAAANLKGVELRVETESGVAPIVVDPVRIAQVLANLVGNAIRHTPAGGVVTITTRRSRTGYALQFEVADTGEGIAAADLPHLFERFYRVDPARSRQTGGSGLGLAIARQLVEAHGGTIGVESEPGRGTRFTVEFPMSVGSAVTATSTRLSGASRSTGQITDDRGETLRVVTDKEQG
jgi:signal transduction histidine kinase